MSDKQADRNIDTGRRNLLKTVGLAGGAAAALGAAGQVAAAAQTEPTTQAPGHKGYQETEHVRAYYETARI